MGRNQKWFSIQNGVLIPPSGYESAQLALSESHPVYVEYSAQPESSKPCVAIGEYHGRFIRLPKAKEMLCVLNTKQGLGYEATNINLLFFWAFNEEKGRKELIVWCYSSHSDEGRRWIALSSTEWRTTPLGLRAVRRFESVEMAQDECPIENMVLLPAKAENGWNRYMVHSPFHRIQKVLEIVVSPGVLDKLDVPAHVQLPKPDWKTVFIDQDSHLSDLCPNLMDEWHDPEECVVDPPQVLMIGVTDLGAFVIVVFQQVDNTNLVVITWKKFHYGHGHRIFARKAKG